MKKKADKIWVHQGSEFYNNSLKDFLKVKNIETYSTYNEGKCVVTKKFIRRFLSTWQLFQKFFILMC